MPQPIQMNLFAPEATPRFNYPFPTTRYQGSKRTLIPWIWEHIAPLPFDTVLDVVRKSNPFHLLTPPPTEKD
jgi:hypothetical protein